MHRGIRAAAPIPVDELMPGQALDLLGRWTGQAQPSCRTPDGEGGGERDLRCGAHVRLLTPNANSDTCQRCTRLASMGCTGLLVGLAGCRLARWGSPGAVSERGARGWTGDPDT